MKKLQKLLTLMLAIIAMFTLCFAGCNGNDNTGNGGGGDTGTHNQVQTLNGKTTAQVYEEIIETVDSYGSNVTATIKYAIPVSITASMDGQTETVDYSIDTITTLKMAGNNFHEKVVMQQHGNGFLPDQMQLTESYFVDDTAYVSIGSSKLMLRGTLAQFAQYAELDMDTVMNPLYDFSDTAFEDVLFAVNKTNEDDVYFELILDGKDAEDFAKNISAASGMMNSAGFELSNIKYKFVINKNGVLDHVEMNFSISMTMNISGVSTVTTMSFNGEINFTDIGTTTIVAPTDVDSYTDLGDLSDYLPDPEA